MEDNISEEVGLKKERSTLNDHLKIFGIWYGICFVLSLIWALVVGGNDLITKDGIISALIYCILEPVFLLLGFIIVFSPTILVLYFLFKKITSIHKRILLAAFMVPFTNMIYWIIAHFWGDVIFPMFIGFLTLFMFLPSALIVTLCTPKSLLPLKKEFIVTNLLMGIFGWILIFISNIGEDFVNNKIALSKLEKYQPVIESLEQYKVNNGVYPETIEDNVKIYKNFSYEPQKDYKDYKLTVNDGYMTFFSYCTNDKIDGCYKGWYHSMKHSKIGKWIKAVDDD